MSSSASAPQETEEAARWIRSQQRGDGTWANYYGGPGDLSTTIEAWVALRLAGDRVDAPHLATRLEFIRAKAGWSGSGLHQLWLALFGAWSWDEVPNLPPEIVYLPKWFPFNLYDWGCWARQTIVPFTIVATRARCDHFRSPRRAAQRCARGADGTCLRAGPARFSASTGAARLWRRPLRVLRRAAIRRGAVDPRPAGGRRVVGRDPAAVGLLDAGPAPDRHALDPRRWLRGSGLEGFLIREQTPDGSVRRLEACQSPVWDTALALTALLDAGVAGDDPAVGRAAGWLLDEEIRVSGDWAVRRPRPQPGGWAFEFAQRRLSRHRRHRRGSARAAAGRAPTPGASAAPSSAGWTGCIGMQCQDGGWGAFDADNTRELAYKLPFCDFGAVDRPAVGGCHGARRRELAAVGLSGPMPAGAASSGCSRRRRPTVPGSAGGAPTTCTAPARWCRRWSPPGCRPLTRGSGARCAG